MFWQGECPFSVIPGGSQNHRKDKVRWDHGMSSIPTPWHRQGPLGHITVSRQFLNTSREGDSQAEGLRKCCQPPQAPWWSLRKEQHGSENGTSAPCKGKHHRPQRTSKHQKQTALTVNVRVLWLTSATKNETQENKQRKAFSSLESLQSAQIFFSYFTRKNSEHF